MCLSIEEKERKDLKERKQDKDRQDEKEREKQKLREKIERVPILTPTGQGKAQKTPKEHPKKKTHMNQSIINTVKKTPPPPKKTTQPSSLFRSC